MKKFVTVPAKSVTFEIDIPDDVPDDVDSQIYYLLKHYHEREFECFNFYLGELK